MNGMITTNEDFVLEEVLPRIREYKRQNVVERTTTISTKVLPGDGCRVALLDMGAKYNIARSLNERGCQVTIYPGAYIRTADSRRTSRTASVLSNGPGDPKDCMPIVDEIRAGSLFHSGVPMFAMSSGASADGSGGRRRYREDEVRPPRRQPSGEGSDDRTCATSLPRTTAMWLLSESGSLPVWRTPAFVNVNDGTNEGMNYVRKAGIFTVQFHPEACPGPQDTGYPV